ncbi:MAG: DUF4831 family protein [Rikenellaceae bacterium]|jgi:hypothetical protein|nr:DUF4831 family protein [Rikenellaceae bacterium]
MKHLFFGLCLVLCVSISAHLSGQSTRATALVPGTPVVGNAVVYRLPQTVLNVTITLRHESVKRGPYARYAQQYLGSVAPLSDKEIYSLVGATLTGTSEADPSAVYVLESPEKSLFDLYYTDAEGFIAFDGSQPTGTVALTPETTIYPPTEGFDGVLVDKNSATASGLEEAAAEAAQALFTLRKRRFDLVTGEAGENVYGAGMEAALREMQRLEEEYIALFMGKRSVQIETRTLQVVPEKGKNTLIVCRFTEEGGLLPDSDLTGRPIVLELTPENKTEALAVPRAATTTGRGGTQGTVFLRMADVVRCRLIDDKTILLTQRVPIYQFGEIAEVPVASVR